MPEEELKPQKFEEIIGSDLDREDDAEYASIIHVRWLRVSDKSHDPEQQFELELMAQAKEAGLSLDAYRSRLHADGQPADFYEVGLFKAANEAGMSPDDYRDHLVSQGHTMLDIRKAFINPEVNVIENPFPLWLRKLLIKKFKFDGSNLQYVRGCDSQKEERKVMKWCYHLALAHAETSATKRLWHGLHVSTNPLWLASLIRYNSERADIVCNYVSAMPIFGGVRSYGDLRNEVMSHMGSGDYFSGSGA